MMQFLLAMFLVVILSSVAFGMLRGTQEAQVPERPSSSEFEEVIIKRDTTSTNTGNLRGE